MSTITKLVTNKFGGIRRKESSFNDSGITCSDCQNVELFFTELNSGVGLRTANGNQVITKHEVSGSLVSAIPSTEEVVGVFESNQNGHPVIFVYTENIAASVGTAGAGKLYTYNASTQVLTPLVTVNLSKTGKACGVDYEQGTIDMFIFSNGQDVDDQSINIVYVGTETDPGGDNYGVLTVRPANEIRLVDPDGNKVVGLGLCVYGARLWVFDGRRLWYSKQAECRIFNFTDPDKITSSGVIYFPKDITAIYNYLGSLAVFHNDSSALVSEDATTLFKRSDESPGGCAGYNALVFHGTDLYFYDDTKKGVFSFQQVVNGDKTLGDNIAIDLQRELSKIETDKLHKIRSLSVITADRNEVWFIVPVNVDDYYYDDQYQKVTLKRTLILIYDYVRGEWVKRKCQSINGVAILSGNLYSYGKEIYKEYVGSTFDGEFIGSYYTCSIFNLGEDNTMKITKLPPRLTVDSSKKCQFYCQYIRNYTQAKKKEKFIKSKKSSGGFKWGASTVQGDTATYGGVVGEGDNRRIIEATGSYMTKRANVSVKLPSVTFKALEITFQTKELGEQFAIKQLEMSKIKVKQV